MKSIDIQKRTGLSRKAIAYYEEVGLIHPSREENGYREYSEADAELLQNVGRYRRLGLGISEIKNLVEGESGLSLSDVVRERAIRLQLDRRRMDLLQALAQGEAEGKIDAELKTLEAQESVFSVLTYVFPGYLGQSFFLNYKPFLQDKIETKEQEEALAAYIEFVDRMPDIVLTEEEKNFLNMASAEIQAEHLESISRSKIDAVEDWENWQKEHAADLQAYKNWKESDEYKSLPIVSIQEKLKKILIDSGYYEQAIPLLRKASPTYNFYCDQLLEAGRNNTHKI